MLCLIIEHSKTMVHHNLRSILLIDTGSTCIPFALKLSKLSKILTSANLLKSRVLFYSISKLWAAFHSYVPTKIADPHWPFFILLPY